MVLGGGASEGGGAAAIGGVGRISGLLGLGQPIFPFEHTVSFLLNTMSMQISFLSFHIDYLRIV